MNDLRKRIIGAGILIICIASMVHASDKRESPSIGWMLALCVTWSLAVWLCPQRLNWAWVKPWSKRCFMIAVFGNALAFSLKFYERELQEKQATKDARILTAEVLRLQEEERSSDFLLSLIRDAKNDELLLEEARRIREALIQQIKR